MASKSFLFFNILVYFTPLYNFIISIYIHSWDGSFARCIIHAFIHSFIHTFSQPS